MMDVEGLDYPEPCANCGDPIETMVGMDNFIEVDYYDTTSMAKEYYCNESCLTEAIQE